MPATLRKPDQEIQEDVYRELKWDSRVDPTEIGVEVDNGVVTLTGTVTGYARKLAAREAAHQVSGVLDVADDIQIMPPGAGGRSDTEIAQAVRLALEWNVFVADQKIRSTVSEGVVTLEGAAETLREKEDAGRAVRELAGVKGVNNRLVVTTKVDSNRIRKSIEEALERRAAREAEKIRVSVEDGTVRLEGRAHTWQEKRAVLGLVRHAPGVREVEDRLFVDP